MEVKNSIINDIDAIFKLYDLATEFQKLKFTNHWPVFSRNLIETEILENRQWKLIIDGKIACVWATTFDDELIWQEKNSDSSVYIHRIATNPDFRGKNLVQTIINYVKQFAIANNKNFIRMDTVGENQLLINHYVKCGFNFLGLSELPKTDGLPKHYENATVSLFEIKL